MKPLSRFPWRRARVGRGAPLLAAVVAAAVAGCSDRTTQFTGIWKTDCKDYWGVQIQPTGDGLYSVTFCGLSGCLEPGTWTPHTRIEGDPMYQVVSARTIRIQRNQGDAFTYTRCSADPSWQVGPPR